MLVAAFCLPRASRAADPFEDPYDLPDAPRPPTLPELTHKDIEGTLEFTFGTLVADRAREGPLAGNARSFIQRTNVEVPLASRRFFVGTTYEFAAGEPPGGGRTKLVGGNLELYGRTVWAVRTGLAFGGGLGIVAPTASFAEGSPAAGVAESATDLRPWDPPFFQNNMAFRPFVDVRALDGDFVIQFRQGLDYAPRARHPSYLTLSALVALYVGYRVARVVGLGLEAFEYYVIDGRVDDAARAQFVVSPSVRLMTRYLQPSLSAFANVGSPISPRLDGSWGLRLAFTVVWDPRGVRLESDHR